MTLVTQEVNVFEEPIELHNYTHVERIMYAPTTINGSTYVFHIPTSDTSFTQSRFTIRMNFRVLADGKAPTIQNVVAPINAIGLTLFGNDSLKIGDQVVESYTDGLFSYLCYCQYHFTYSKEAKEGYLKDTMLLADDDATQFEVAGNSNTGWLARAIKVAFGRICSTSCELPFSFCQSNKLIPPKTNIQISLTRQSDDFVLMSGDEETPFHLKIDNIELEVTRCRLKSNIVDALYDNWNRKGYMEFFFNRLFVLGPYPIANNTSVISQRIGEGSRPDFIASFFVDSSAVLGSIMLNPFHFQHLDVNFAQASFENQLVPSVAFKPTFRTSDTDLTFSSMREYVAMLETLGLYLGNSSNNIGYLGFNAGNTLLCFNFDETLVSTGYRSSVRDKGVVKLDFRLRSPTNTSCYMYCLVCMPASVKLSSKLVPSFNYQIGSL